MRKIIIACAVLLTGILSSCGDTNYCYELTTTVNLLGVTSSTVAYIWGTSNELDVAIDEAEAALEASGLSKDAFSITYKRTYRSQAECHN